MLRAKRNNKLLVGLLLARLIENAHVRLATVQGLGRLAQTAGKTIVDQGDLEDTLQGLEDGHLALGGVGADLDIGDFGDVLGLFSVRLWGL